MISGTKNNRGRGKDMRYYKVFITAAVITTALLLSIQHLSYAEVALGPMTKTIQLSAGSSEAVEYKLYNSGEEPVTVEISARTWFRLPENQDIEVSDWLDIKTDKITLEPKHEHTLNFVVDVPKQAVGELAAMIYFTPEQEESQMLKTSYGASLYVFVKGTEIVEPRIGEVIISKRDETYYIAVAIENKGNVHFRPKVKADITSGEFKETVVLPFGKPIFGGQDYVFAEKIIKQLPKDAVFDVDVTCNYGDIEDTIVKKQLSISAGDIEK
jgi:hypothetical protein